MAKPDDTVERIEPVTSWGTWEELLLACAVHRYGTKCWDSVAIEIQKRSSTPTIHHLLTPHHCKQKYKDLKRRYTLQNGAVSPSGDDDDDDDKEADAVLWLEELRKLRVAELKRELERYDLSIVSLQLKVKRLKEEREESLREGENGGDKSDLEKIVQRKREEEETREERGQPEKFSPELVAGEPATGEESNRDDHSVNESNSTDSKGRNRKTGQNFIEPEPVRAVDGEGEDPDLAAGSTKPVGENSCNGSSDSIEKEPVRESVKPEPDGVMSESPELWESVAESKGGGGGEEGTAKESSDVQSSASKSRKEGGSDKMPLGCISGDEPEHEDQSPAVKRIAIKSQPLADFLEIIRSHKLGSVFERRLESQETPEYKNMIRQHIDLETMQMRLEGGLYSGASSKFFRDLLLLFNNAILFFGKKSRESSASIELRQIISKQMTQNQRSLKPDLSAGEQTSSPPVPVSSKPGPEPSDSLLLKPNVSGPMIVCRKRSSIAAKASGSSSGTDRKEQKAALLEEKPLLDWKQASEPSRNAEEPRVTKKRTSERSVSGSRSSKKNGKNRSSTNQKKNPETLSSQNQGKAASSSEQSEAKSEKNTVTTTAITNTNAAAGVKKRSAANFLNRMKQSSATNNGSLLETLKSSAIGSSNNNKGGGAEQKSSGNGRGEGKKEPISRRGLGGKQTKEQESPAKRSVGRPPKRAAAPPHTPPVLGRRSREGGDTETAAASRQPKKRARK